jgi:hypothetical protein
MRDAAGMAGVIGEGEGRRVQEGGGGQGGGDLLSKG